MNDIWRELLYPLGLLSGVAFALRFLIQWYLSEKLRRTVVPPSFWKISLFGNLALLCHAFIQMQFHIYIVQACNAVISWRNLNLMQPIEKQYRLSTVIIIMVASASLLSMLFVAQFSWLNDGVIEWFRVPKSLWNSTENSINSLWHIVGTIGLLMYNCRFWVQWWGAEKAHNSSLNESFWWLSLGGSVLLLIYFTLLGDEVNLISPLVGFVPYARNLVIMRNSKPKSSLSAS